MQSSMTLPVMFLTIHKLLVDSRIDKQTDNQQTGRLSRQIDRCKSVLQMNSLQREFYIYHLIFRLGALAFYYSTICIIYQYRLCTTTKTMTAGLFFHQFTLSGKPDGLYKHIFVQSAYIFRSDNFFIIFFSCKQNLDTKIV